MTEEQRDAFLDGTLEAYGVGVLRTFVPPRRRRGQFHVDTTTFCPPGPTGRSGPGGQFSAEIAQLPPTAREMLGTDVKAGEAIAYNRVRVATATAVALHTPCR